MKRKQQYLWLAGLFLLAFTSCKPTAQNLWNGKDFNGWEFVLANDSVSPENVWSVSDGVIHCKGAPNGYMRTKEQYFDFELEVEWRWPEKPGNSGVFLNAQMPDQVWPNCIECQLEAGNAGEFILIGPGSSLKVHDSLYTCTDIFLRLPKNEESSEKPAGEWNHYKISCTGQEISCYVNGVLQNQGTDPSLKQGYICLQSEGAPIEFRKIHLTPIK